MSKPRVLHFEDDPAFAEKFGQRLRQAGFEVRHFTNPSADPVSIVMNEKPDLIISDIVMPVMNGIASARCIKADQRTKHIPLILLSSLCSRVDMQAGREVADQYVVKYEGGMDEAITYAKSFVSV
ncbi:MAG: response regulator [Candidatus Nomurabacteria bacterium]|nr:MAG: response regulator [Candidatus Nomurabacteria bacterium]